MQNFEAEHKFYQNTLEWPSINAAKKQTNSDRKNCTKRNFVQDFLITLLSKFSNSHTALRLCQIHVTERESALINSYNNKDEDEEEEEREGTNLKGETTMTTTTIYGSVWLEIFARGKNNFYPL